MVRRTGLHMNTGHRLGLLFLFTGVLLGGLIFPSGFLYAEESVCAVVKIEIKQEMTFERQAFDAHMQINNGLTTISLENIDVDVLFSNEQGEAVRASSNPDDPDALFFIRIDTMEGIDDVAGSGTIAPATTGDIHWLIIPAPASVEDFPVGALYFVGARLSYDLGGEEHVTHVTPDSITVRPLPLLSLDYFLPDEVYGDDPFTIEEEPSIPFSLGVRISNNGHGVATDVKIDSAQPKIIDNEQELTVDFLIEGSEVDGIVAQDTLLLQFGDIEPAASTIGRWLMSCSLSGRFTEFKVTYSHSNELGGELTSLIEDVETHFLVQDVLVDAPGRDTVRDFLGRDMDLLKVYESDAGIADVIDLSEEVRVVLISEVAGVAKYSVEAVPTAGFFYLQFTDLQGGEKVVSEVVRSDGKVLKRENGWLSKKRVGEDWFFYTSIFDYNSSGSYLLTLIDPALAPQPPSFEEQENPVQKEGEEVSFIISLVDNAEPEAASLKMMSVAMTAVQSAVQSESTECDGKTEISVGRLPVGARLIDRCDGTAILIWTPREGQAGDYPLTFTATDGEFSTTVRYHLTITDVNNTPTARFSTEITSGEAPFTVPFIDDSLSEDGISSWFWDFGDGSTGTGPIPNHIYDTEGSYSVSLTVTEIDGDEHSITLEDYITADDGTVITPGMDSDNDGFSDELEILHGFDPADGQDFPTSPIMEFATITADGIWQTVRFERRYLDPVVVATITGYSWQASYVEIGDISSESFKVRTTAAGKEDISYVVMEQSSYRLADGTLIIAGSTEAAPVDGKIKYKFDTDFALPPVVMISLVSGNNPGVVSVALDKVKKGKFVFSLQTDKSNRKSTTSERVDFIAWQPSAGVIAEFVFFEAGYFDHINRWWQDFMFSTPLYGIQSFVAASQRKSKGKHQSVTFRNLSWSGIEARLVKSAKKRLKHGKAGSVGFIALSFIPLDLDSDGDGLTDRDEIQMYGTDPTLFDSDGDGLGDGAELAWWGEDWNGDSDNDGFVNILDIDSDNDGYNDGLEFAHGFDPVDPLDLPDGPIMGSAYLSVGSGWQNVSFDREYLDPVVVAVPAVNIFSQAVVRVRNVVATGFEIRHVDQENDVSDTTAVSYIVMERGIYTLPDGEKVIAEHSTLAAGSMYAQHIFSNSFTTSPVIIASLVDCRESDSASVGLSKINPFMFYFGLYDSAGYAYLNNPAGIDYIAWEPSVGQIDTHSFSVNRFKKVNHKWRKYLFGMDFPTPPVIVAMNQEIKRSQRTVILERNISVTDIEMRVESNFENSKSSRKVKEKVGVIAISKNNE